MQIIVKQSYNHVNKAFPNWNTPQGVKVKNKDHYEYLMKKNNMVSFEENQQRSENSKKKDYVICQDTKAIIRAAKAAVTSKGKVQLGGKLVQAMIDKKIIHKKDAHDKYLPSSYKLKG